jgi:WD40 repeat protein/uncharacterized protein YraI
MSIFRGSRKRSYGEPGESSVNVFLIVVVLAAITLLCLLIYALVKPTLVSQTPEYKIVPYGSGSTTPSPFPTAASGVPPTAAAVMPTLTTVPPPTALLRITASNVGNVQPIASLSGHSSPVSSVAFSLDGRFLASGDWNGLVKLWNASTDIEIYTFRSASNRVNSVAFSPDGTRLAAGGQDTVVRWWDLVTGTELKELTGPTRAVNAVAFSPVGNLVAVASDDGTVYLWDATTGDLKGLLSGHTSYATSLAFSPDGKTLAAGGEDDTIRLWSVPGGTSIAVLKGHTSTVSSVAFSPDGTTLASTGADHTVRLWNVLSESQVMVLQGHTENVNSVAFSPDGAMLATGAGGIEDNTVRLWDVGSGTALRILSPGGPVNSVAFSPDGTRLATGGATFLTIWAVTTAAPVVSNPLPTATPSPVNAQASGQGGQAAEGCVLVSRVNDANLRSGPGTDYPVLGTLALNQSVQADGWVTGADGFTWWRLTTGSWARGDVFVDAANPNLPDACWQLQPVATVPPAPTASTFSPQAAAPASPAAATPAQPCTLTSRVADANLRSAPSTDASVVGTLQLNQAVQVIGWVTGADGFTWWRLTTGSWARGDVFVDAANPNLPDACWSLPQVAP